MKNLALLACVFVYSTVVNAQEKSTLSTSKLPPSSIYTLKNTENKFSAFTINKNLNFKDLSFIIVDRDDIDNGNLSIPIKHIGKKPSSLIYDDYWDYQFNNLLKGFIRKNDPTRWQPRELQLQ